MDPAKEEVSPDDLITLAPYLLQLTIVPEEADEAAIGSANDNKTYIAWKQGLVATDIRWKVNVGLISSIV